MKDKTTAQQSQTPNNKGKEIKVNPLYTKPIKTDTQTEDIQSLSSALSNNESVRADSIREERERKRGGIL